MPRHQNKQGPQTDAPGNERIESLFSATFLVELWTTVQERSPWAVAICARQVRHRHLALRCSITTHPSVNDSKINCKHRDVFFSTCLYGRHFNRLPMRQGRIHGYGRHSTSQPEFRGIEQIRRYAVPALHCPRCLLLLVRGRA